MDFVFALLIWALVCAIVYYIYTKIIQPHIPAPLGVIILVILAVLAILWLLVIAGFPGVLRGF